MKRICVLCLIVLMCFSSIPIYGGEDLNDAETSGYLEPAQGTTITVKTPSDEAYNGTVNYVYVYDSSYGKSARTYTGQVVEGQLNLEGYYKSTTSVLEIYVYPVDGIYANSQLMDITPLMTSGPDSPMGTIKFQTPVNQGTFTGTDNKDDVKVTVYYNGTEERPSGTGVKLKLGQGRNFSAAPLVGGSYDNISLSVSQGSYYFDSLDYALNDRAIVFDLSQDIVHTMTLNDPNNTPYSGFVTYAVTKADGSMVYESLYVSRGKMQFKLLQAWGENLQSMVCYPEDMTYAATASISLEGMDYLSPAKAFSPQGFKAPSLTGKAFYDDSPLYFDEVTATFVKEGLVDDVHIINITTDNSFAFAPSTAGYDDLVILSTARGSQTFPYDAKDVIFDPVKQTKDVLTLEAYDKDGLPYSGPVDLIFSKAKTFLKISIEIVDGKGEINMVEEGWLSVSMNPKDHVNARSAFQDLGDYKSSKSLGIFNLRQPYTQGVLMNENGPVANQKIQLSYFGDQAYEAVWEYTDALGRFSTSPDKTGIYTSLSINVENHTFNNLKVDAKDLILTIGKDENPSKKFSGRVLTPDGKAYDGKVDLIGLGEDSILYTIPNIECLQGEFEIRHELEFEKVFLLPVSLDYANSLWTGVGPGQRDMGDIHLQTPWITGHVYNAGYKEEMTLIVSYGEMDDDNDSWSLSLKDGDYFASAPLYEESYEKVHLRLISQENQILLSQAYPSLAKDIELRKDAPYTGLILDTSGQAFTGDVRVKIQEPMDADGTYIVRDVDVKAVEGYFEFISPESQSIDGIYMFSNDPSQANTQLKKITQGQLDLGRLNFQEPWTRGRIVSKVEKGPLNVSVTYYKDKSFLSSVATTTNDKGEFAIAPLQDLEASDITKILVQAYSYENGSNQEWRVKFSSDVLNLNFDAPLLEPSLVINGGAHVDLAMHQEYLDPGATYTNSLGEKETIYAPEADPKTKLIKGFSDLGPRILTYTKQVSSTEIMEVTRTINVTKAKETQDTELPVVVLKGSDKPVVYLDDDYRDAGYYVKDNSNKKCSVEEVYNDLDMTQEGHYTITFVATDPSGNKSLPVSRSISVVDKKPYINISGIEDKGFYTGQVKVEVKSDGDKTIGVTRDGQGIDFAEGIFSDDGHYIITVSSKRPHGHLVRTMVRSFVINTLEPSLVLNGQAQVTLEYNEVYDDPGASFIDYTRETTVMTEDVIDYNRLGDNVLTYKATDMLGKVLTPVTRRVTVVDTTAPVLTLLGDINPVVVLNETYADPGYEAFDAFDKTAQVLVEGQVNTHRPGIYTLKYTLTDGSGNQSQALRKVTVKDQAPSFSIVNVEEGGLYNSPVAYGLYSDESFKISYDISLSKDGEILVLTTNRITESGRYRLTVEGRRINGQLTTKRVVNFTIDQEAPVLSLEADERVTTLLDEAYQPPTVDAHDDIDGPVAVEISGQVNVEKVGEYALVYKATDAAGNTSSVTRTVVVVDQAPTLEVKGLVDGQWYRSPIMVDIITPGVYTSHLTRDGKEVTLNASGIDASGHYILTVVARRPHGTLTTSQTFNVSLDLEAPILASNIEDKTYTRIFTPTFTVSDKMTSKEALVVTKVLDGQAYKGAGIGNADGIERSHILVVTAKDLAGNLTQKTYSFKTNIPKPAPPIVGPNPTPTVFNIVEGSIDLEVGTEAVDKTRTLTFLYSNVSVADMTWRSSDESVATVDKDGKVTAVGVGRAVITASSQNVFYKDTCAVEVFLVGDEITPEGAVNAFTPYIEGYGNNTFRPLGKITRAEVATILTNALKLKMPEEHKVTYTDLQDQEWYYEAVQSVTSSKIFEGYPDGSFKPNEVISRSEMAKVVLNLMTYLEMKPQVTPHDGFKLDHWASKAIYNMYHNDYVKAYDEEEFLVDQAVLREEMVYMMNRVFGIKPSETSKKSFDDVDENSRFYGDIKAASGQ